MDNLYFEKAVLGAIFLEPEKIKQVSEILPDEQYFMNAFNREIYKVFIKFHNENKKFDINIFLNYIDNYKLLEKCGDTVYISSLSDNATSTVGVEHYATQVRETWLHRKIQLLQVHKRKELLENPFETKDIILKYIELETRLLEENYIGQKHIKNMNNIVEHDLEAPTIPKKFIKTGYKHFDYLNFEPDEIIVIAARPSVGKTSFMVNLAYQIYKNNIEDNVKVIYFPIESVWKKVAEKIGSVITGEPVSNFRNKKSIVRFSHILDNYNPNNFMLVDKCQDLREQINFVTRERTRYPNSKIVVFSDYWQICKFDSKKNSREQQLGEMAEALIKAKTDLELTWFVGSQVNKLCESGKPPYIPRMSHARESESIANASDKFISLYSPNYYNHYYKDNQYQKESPNWLLYASCEKNRNHSIFDCEFMFEKAIAKFTPITNEYEEPIEEDDTPF